jgi:hypothetical protein
MAFNRPSEPYYVVCQTGAHGWFWAGWESNQWWFGDEAAQKSQHPDCEGSALTEVEAHTQARLALHLPPFIGSLHGPGSQRRRRAQGVQVAHWAADVLRRRALEAKKSRPSRRTESQVSRVVYKMSSSSSAYGEPSYTAYTPHRVHRESPRFFWVNTECLETEAIQRDFSAKHPDQLRTLRLDRLVLEAGEEYTHRGSWWYTWVLQVPYGAVEQQGGRWYASGGRPQRAPVPATDVPSCFGALGLAWPCTDDDVKHAYRTLAFAAHPDQGGSAGAFQALRAAYAAALTFAAQHAASVNV